MKIVWHWKFPDLLYMVEYFHSLYHVQMFYMRNFLANYLQAAMQMLKTLLVIHRMEIIIKCGTCLISRVWSISKWLPHWIYYDLNTINPHKQPHFTHIRTYQVFVSFAHTAGMVNTCSNIANVRDRSTSKTQFSSSSHVFMFLCFFLVKNIIMQ